MRDHLANRWFRIGFWLAVALMGVGAFQVRRRRRGP